MFVPAMPDGELARQIQEADDRMREGSGDRRVKVVERGGETLMSKLCRNNPWGSRRCERDNCLYCPHSKEGKGGACKREGVVYKIVCIKCEQEKVRAEYWGETSRTGFERGEEHVTGLESRYEKNALWKHIEGDHRGEEKGNEIFSRQVEKGFKKPLARQK